MPPRWEINNNKKTFPTFISNAGYKRKYILFTNNLNKSTTFEKETPGTRYPYYLIHNSSFMPNGKCSNSNLLGNWLQMSFTCVHPSSFCSHQNSRQYIGKIVWDVDELNKNTWIPTDVKLDNSHSRVYSLLYNKCQKQKSSRKPISPNLMTAIATVVSGTVWRGFRIYS